MYWSKEKRAKSIVYLSLVGFLILFGRLLYLQVIKAPYYQKISDENRIRIVPVPAPRGMIYDRNGQTIVSNRASFTVALYPYEMRGQSQTLSTVSRILEQDSASLRKKIERPWYSAYEPVPVQRDADFPAIAKIAEQNENLPGVLFQAEPTRKYPDKGRATHLMGYVSEISEEELEISYNQGLWPGAYIGKMGIEKQYDELLRGRAGAHFYEVTAKGRIIGKLPDKEEQVPLAGVDLALTLDLDLQILAESLLSEYARGCIVALDPQNGEILCLASQPGFDANSFVSVLSSEDWQKLIENPNFPLLNRAIQSTYPPGSTLKLMMAGAALESGLVTPQSTFRPCYGGYQLGERFFRCWDPQGHGTQDLKGAIVRSCDTYFYQLGLRMGVDLISDYAVRCGFGTRVRIDLPQESKGFVPSSVYYDKRFGRKGWTKSLALNLAIGQGEFLVTPLQLASFYGALANDGMMYQPHLLKAIRPQQGKLLEYQKTVLRRLPFSKSTLEFLNQACIGVVNDPGGTGKQAALPGITVAGKTGSAQNPHGETHSWFVGYAPAEKARIAVCVLIENAGHGGDVAAPIVGQIIERYLRRDKELARTGNN